MVEDMANSRYRLLGFEKVITLLLSWSFQQGRC